MRADAVGIGMRYVNWQCRLYGHQWRHQGEYEVVLTGGSDTSFPFRCDACDARMSLDGNGDRSHGEPYRASGTLEPELQSPAEPDCDARPEDG